MSLHRVLVELPAAAQRAAESERRAKIRCRMFEF